MGPEMMHSVGMAWGWILPTLVVLAGGYVGWRVLRGRSGRGEAGGDNRTGDVADLKLMTRAIAALYHLGPG